MGVQVSKIMGKIFGTKEMRLLMLGLDAAGKTSKPSNHVQKEEEDPTLTLLLAILYKLKLDQDVTTIPTVGFNVETVTYKNVKFNVWDVGGQDKIRPLWRHYFSGTQGLIFVIDSHDRDRIDEARQELHRIISDREMKESLLLVFANKQDIPGCMPPSEVTEKLQLHKLKDRVWVGYPTMSKHKLPLANNRYQLPLVRDRQKSTAAKSYRKGAAEAKPADLSFKRLVYLHQQGEWCA
ncbi:uncharacterized protein H6S33_011562 [Morchella sextelata]|uniref:uncharacterized protein n=1 Tax=Morchella sextelata TaxID=1174677 RepID=UPI001D046BF2|nr:uncharacterized protein H6S33_011562 [Morchella sextelata]KAH0611135.1 hypothetical protein H6S33_011562 [Morchella sextelata]